MKESEFKQTVKGLLENLGLQTNDIPRRTSKTPDFDARGKADRYTIELKIKGDNPEEIEEEAKALVQGGIVSREIPTGRRNTLYGIITEGVQQIAEHDPQHNTFHIIWLHFIGQDPDLLNMRFHATLFGIQKFFSVKKKYIMTCYYFNESGFYSYREDLDGVILTCHNQLQLCVNTLSPHLKDFRNSELYKALSKGLCDPDLFHNTEGVMIADCEIDRRKHSEVIDYLRKKYKLEHLQTIDMKQYSGKIALPDRAENLRIQGT